MNIDYEGKLISFLASLPPEEGEEIGKAEGGRVLADGLIVGRVPEGAARSPRDWLNRYGIPICEMPAGHKDLAGAAATFIHRRINDQHFDAKVCIPIGSDINSARVGWNVWHEIGHAMDYVTTREGKVIATPHGQYSTAHIEMLRRHQETIIQWTPCPDREYKTKPEELWAEAVACCVCAPLMCPPELFVATVPDMLKRGIPVTYEHDKTDQGASDGSAAEAGPGPD